MKLDEIDFRMLEILQTDARIPVLELADKVGLSPTPCSRRLRRLETEGIIANYYAALDPRAIGLDVTAFISVRVRHSPELAAKFTAAIQKMPNIRGCYRLTGSYDYLLRIHATDMNSLSRWLQDRLHTIPSVLHTHTSIVMESIKDEPVFPLKALAELERETAVRAQAASR
jgi:Lrp/AsnC family leucine-responsive transcriptional regulator